MGLLTWARAAAALVAAGGALVGCAARDPTRPSEAPQEPVASAAPAARGEPEVRVASSSPPGPQAPTRLLGADEARRVMVELINRDRASEGLPPVELDEGPAMRAGQAHAEDMASHGYLGHWGTDGSVPEQRFSESGGVDMVLENASCFTDERKRALDPSPRFDRKNIELAESMFFHETPPNDGHRQNILKPWHKKVGIGLAQPVATPTEIPVPCVAQEFVDSFGTYTPVPRSMKTGDPLHVEGTIASPATFAGVGLARVDWPKPIAVDDLNQRRSYPVPTPYQMYWPPGYVTPIAVHVSAGHFRVDLPLGREAKPGMYEVSVWASVPGSRDFVMVSLRTIHVR